MRVPKLGVLEVDVSGDPIVLDLDAIVPIDNDNLSEEFSDQPTMYAYIAMLAARAEAVWLDAKNGLARIRAETDGNVRHEFEDAGIKTTEARISSEIESRRGYREAVDYELDCREQYYVLRAVVQTMDMRAQMLISLGAHLRAEANQTGMLIKETRDKLKAIRGK